MQKCTRYLLQTTSWSDHSRSIWLASHMIFHKLQYLRPHIIAFYLLSVYCNPPLSQMFAAKVYMESTQLWPNGVVPYEMAPALCEFSSGKMRGVCVFNSPAIYRTVASALMFRICIRSGNYKPHSQHLIAGIV